MIPESPQQSTLAQSLQWLRLVFFLSTFFCFSISILKLRTVFFFFYTEITKLPQNFTIKQEKGYYLVIAVMGALGFHISYVLCDQNHFSLCASTHTRKD